MNKRYLLTIIALLAATVALAQENRRVLTGIVRDSSGVLEGASVYLYQDSMNQKVIEYTSSNAQGAFTITVPEGDYMLGVSFLGYAPHKQKVYAATGTNDLGSIVLQPTAEELQTVIIQGEPMGVRAQPDGFVVSVKNLTERCNDALDLLKHIPNVQVNGDKLKVIGKENALVKIGNVLQRVEASELPSVLKGYDAKLVERVEVITQPPLRYDPDGNTAMIVLHTTSIFKEYMGGVIGTEEMWGGKDNFRYGGYASLMYNRKGLFASIAPAINFNGSKFLEQQEYQAEQYQYHTYTPSTGRFNYMGIRGNLQYTYRENNLVGVAFGWNRKKHNNQFESLERTVFTNQPERIIENENGYRATAPRITATAYWEATLKPQVARVWTEVAYFNLTNRSQTTYAGREAEQQNPFLEYFEGNKLNTQGGNLSHDYAIYLDSASKYLLETGVKGSWSTTTNFREHRDELNTQGTTIEQSNNIRWNELVMAPYITGTFRFSGQWWMRVGLRYTGIKSNLKQLESTAASIPNVDKYHDAWLPLLHASYRPTPKHQITLTLNSAITQPRFQDLNPFEWQVSENSFYRGNTELRPELNYITSLGYTFDGALSFKVKFRQAFNVISTLSFMQDSRVYTQRENAQNSLFLGAEAGYYFDKLSWMSASINVYYGRNRFTAIKEYLLPRIARGNEWGADAYMDFTFNKKRTWTGYIHGSYTGRKKTAVSIIEPLYDLGVGMSYFLFDRRLSITVAGESLLPSHYKGISERDGGYTIVFENQYSSPTLYVSISYKFSNARDATSSRSRGARDVERRF